MKNRLNKKRQKSKLGIHMFRKLSKLVKSREILLPMRPNKSIRKLKPCQIEDETGIVTWKLPNGFIIGSVK